MKIILNKDLVASEIAPSGDFFSSFEDIKLKGRYPNQTYEQSKKIVVHDVEENAITHSNMLEYLSLCWKNHYGVVLKPDMIWFDLLCELAIIIKANPDKYRRLFTDSDEKKQITILTGDPEVMPMKALLAELKRLVPTEVDLFLPTFSTGTEKSLFAHSVAFADCASPYYNYSMYMCGIPSVTLDGTGNDWNRLYESWIAIIELMELPSKGNTWADKVSNHLYTLALIADGDSTDALKQEFLSDIFRLKKCGSGSQVEVFGWYAELFKDIPRVRYLGNFSSHKAQIKYKNLDTEKQYQMFSGVFSSKVEGAVLIPDYNMVVVEVLETPVSYAADNTVKMVIYNR